MLFVWNAAQSTGEATTVRVWNLVEWLILEKGVSGAGAMALYVIGALLCMVLPYLLGSINPAVIISKLVYRDDIRNHGSGNAGTTNMLRTYGVKAAVFTFLCDLLKAALAVVIGRLLWSYMGAAIAGFFVAFGHMFPIFAHFRGGKGVACLAMVIALLSPVTFLFLVFVFALSLIGTRMVSFASIMCAFFYPLILRAFDGDKPFYVAMAVISAVFVVVMHHENIKRIMAGKESKIDFSKFRRKKKKSEEDGEGDAQ